MIRLHITVTGRTALDEITSDDAGYLVERLEERFRTDENGLEASATEVKVNEGGYSEFTVGLISHEDYDALALETWISAQDGGYIYEAGADDPIEAISM